MSKRQTKPQGVINAQLDEWRSIREDTCQSMPYVQGDRGPRLKEEQEVEKSMRRWGIDPTQDAFHKAFWTQAKSIVSENVRGQGQALCLIELDPVEPEELPQDDRVSAIMMFLGVEITAIASSALIRIRDLLRECHPDLPFCPPFSWDNNLIPAYQHVAARELDPLLRFVASPIGDGGEQDLRQRFQDDKTPYQYNDLVLKGMVAHHMSLSSTHCLGCNAPDTLR